MADLKIDNAFELLLVQAHIDTHQEMLMMLDRIGIPVHMTMEDDLLNYEAFINSVLDDGDFTLTQLLAMEIDAGDICVINPPEDDRMDDATLCARCIEWLGEKQGTDLHIAHMEFRTTLTYLVWAALTHSLAGIARTLPMLIPTQITLTLSENDPWLCWCTIHHG